jgi:DHA3 family macrolide efflux protein-like MFS transporter
VLIVGIFLGLVLGLLAGGSLTNLASIRLRWIALLSAAVILRFGTEAALNAGIVLAETLRVPLLAAAFGALLAGLWANRTYPVVMIANGGYMPIWELSLEIAGFTPADVQSAIHQVVSGDIGGEFLLRLGPLGDVIPIPFPFIRNVASVGDVFLTAGLAFFLFAGTVRTRAEVDAEHLAIVHDRLAGLAGTARLPRTIESGLGDVRVRPETGLAPSLVQSSALERPLVLGGGGPGMASPALAPLPRDPALGLDVPGAMATSALPLPTAPAIPRPAPEVVERVRRHPYVRLALNSSFTALWTGQLVSLFGDRLHQVALAAVVLITTGSALATGLVFMVATLPNLLFGPLAGTLVDRWEHKEVLIVSDILRAGVVLLIPVAVTVHIGLVYPLVFLVTTISIFFRPARVAVLPRIVAKDDLLTANSALWVAETSADIVGYPLAAVFVAALGAALPLAFWIDAATYIGSAVLLSAMVVVPRPSLEAVEQKRGFVGELKDGWRFLRREPTLLANTIQATIAQFSIGVLVALTIIYAERVIADGSGFDFKAVYGFLETGIGAGNLIGGFVIGLVGSQFAKGRMIIGGYAVMGLCMLLLAVVADLGLALGLMFGVGVANMVFVIPSQTLFQERTPNELMGRVVSFRFALVGGAMTVAMGTGGVLAEFLPVTVVIAVFGVLTLGAGLGGLFVPAIRDA